MPSGIASGGGNLFVAEWATGRVLQVIENGLVLDPAREVARGLAQPEGLALTEAGALLVVETGAHALSQIDVVTGRKTVLTDDLDIALTAPAGYPPTWVFNGVAVDECGVIYVTEDQGSSVARIAPPHFNALHCHSGPRP